MTCNILNFPEYTIPEVEEFEHDYRVHASINALPKHCPECHQ